MIRLRHRFLASEASVNPLTIPCAPPSLNELAARLHPLHTRPDELPVGGYRFPPGSAPALRSAAVLVAVTGQDEPAVVLTVRSRAMSLHAGQVALPGGRREANEAFPLDTAIRETAEETGISPDSVQPLGLLDCYDTITGFRVVPVVARILGQPALKPCPNEVEDIFTVPLDQVLSAASYRHHSVRRGGHTHELVTLAHPRWMIWGATAAILHQLSQLL